MYFPENMTAAYFFFDTYPGYFLQALPIALLIGGLWAFRLRKTALPLPERLRSVLFACYLTGLFCLTLFQPVIAELYRLLFGLPSAGLHWSVNFSFRLSPGLPSPLRQRKPLQSPDVPALRLSLPREPHRLRLAADGICGTGALLRH